MKKQILTLCLLALTFFAKAGAPFITRWDMSQTGSGANQISFNVTTSGNVNYTWETVPAGTSGSGIFLTGFNSDTISGLPSNAIIRLKIDSVNFNAFAIGNSDNERLVDVEQWGSVLWTSMENAFNNSMNLNVTAIDIPNLSIVTTMGSMFANCNILNTPSNINMWDTKNITYMGYLFYNAKLFNQPLNNWNTSNVTNMIELFSGAKSFNQPIGNWNTSNVTTMNSLFLNATSFNQQINNWNTSKVTDMSSMFSNTILFNQPIGNWNTSKLTNTNHMFDSAIAFNQPIGNWNMMLVSIMSGMFTKAISFNQPLNNWNTSNVMFMDNMFQNATSFNQPIENWNINNVIYMNSMFQNATSFNQPLNNWNTSYVGTMIQMFQNANSFNQPLNNWNIGHLNYMMGMFKGANSFNQSLGNWNINGVSNIMIQNFFDSSGMDCHNYAATLKGWANNPLTPNSLQFGAANIHYGTNATTYRDSLIINKGWTISGDIADNSSCNPTAINNISNFNNALNIYPNPAKNFATIELSNTEHELASIKIFNTLGQQVFADNIQTTQGKNLYNLPCQALGNGIYTVCIAINNTKAVKQWVISN